MQDKPTTPERMPPESIYDFIVVQTKVIKIVEKLHPNLPVTQTPGNSLGKSLQSFCDVDCNE